MTLNMYVVRTTYMFVYDLFTLLFRRSADSHQLLCRQSSKELTPQHFILENWNNTYLLFI